MPLSLVLEGNLDIDEYAEFTGDKATINGHYYSDKGPSMGFLMLPVLYLTDLVYPLDQLEPAKQLKLTIILGAILFGSLPFSLCAYLIFNLHLKEQKYGVALIILFFFGSFLFIFSGSFYSHSFSAFLLMISALTLERKRYLASGFLIGLAFITEYTLAVFGLTMGLYLLIHNRSKIAFFIIGALVPIIFQGFFNYLLTGSALDFAYKYQENFIQNSAHYGFGWPSLQALYDITLSPYRGLFFYAPMLLIILFLIDWGRVIRSTSKTTIYFICGCAAYIVLFSMSKSWHGGWSYGPRYLYPLPVLLLFLLTKEHYLRSKRIYLLLISGMLGLAPAFLDKATVLYPQTDFHYPLSQLILPAVENGKWNKWNLFSEVGLNAGSAFVLFTLLFFTIGIFLSVIHFKFCSEITKPD